MEYDIFILLIVQNSKLLWKKKTVQAKEWDIDNDGFNHFYKFVSSFKFVDSQTGKNSRPFILHGSLH